MSKVQLKDQLGRVVQINGDATKGATLGVNVYRADGKTLVTEADIGLSNTSGEVAGPLWENVRQRPANLLALAAITAIGVAVRIGPNQWRQRTLRASGGLLMRNGDGVNGDPIVQMLPVIDSGDGAALVKVTIDGYGRVIATAAATTDDLGEGGANLYFTDARAYAKVSAGIAAHVAEADPHPQYIAAGSLAGLNDAADDTAAAGLGVPVGGMYRNGSVLRVRIS